MRSHRHSGTRQVDRSLWAMPGCPRRRYFDSPSPPPTPNAGAVAFAQQMANTSTAIANTVLSNANESHPQGTVTYTQSSIYYHNEPIYNADGTLAGTTLWPIPVYTRTVAHTSTESTIFGTEQATRQQMATIALAQASRLNTATSSSVSTASLQTVAAAPALPAYAAITSPAALDTAAVAVPTLPDAPNVRALASAPAAPSLTTTALATPSMPSAIVAPDLPTAPSAATITTTVPTAPVIDGMLSDAGPVWDVVGSSDFATAKQTVIDAVRDRLDYQIGLDRTSLIARLTNQGILTGSEAYANEMQIFTFRENDATTQAVLAGGQEQTRLFNLEVARAQFYNAAQAQRHSQHVLIIEIANRAEIQTFEWGAKATQIANEFQLAALQASITQKNAESELLLKEFGADMQAAEFSRSLAISTAAVGTQISTHNAQLLLQQLQANLEVATMTSKFALDAYQMDATTAKLDADLLGQTFEMGMRADQFANTAKTADFANAIQYRQAENNRLLQLFQAGIHLRDYEQSKRERELQELLTLRNQPLNEIATMLRGSQLALPQFKQYQAGTIANTNVGDMIYKSAEMDQKNYEAKVGQQAAMFGAIAGVAGAGVSAYFGRPKT